MIFRPKPGMNLKWGILLVCIIAFVLFLTVPQLAEIPLPATVFIAVWLSVMAWGAYINLRDHLESPPILDIGRDGVRIFRGPKLSRVPGVPSAFLDWRIVEDMCIAKEAPRSYNHSTTAYFGWTTRMQLSEQPDQELARMLGTPFGLRTPFSGSQPLVRFVGIELLDQPEQAVYDEFYRSWSAWRSSRGLGVGTGHEAPTEDIRHVPPAPAVAPTFWEGEGSDGGDDA